MGFTDNWVPPDVLFDADDPGTTGPLADAFDVQFRVPVSLAVYADDLARTGRRHELAALRAVLDRLAGEVATTTQHNGGYVARESGMLTEARLAMAVSVELEVPGVAGLHPHVHVYVGGTATDLSDGETRPVDEVPLHRGADSAWNTFHRRLLAYTGEQGLTWGEHRPGAPDEVIDPPYAEHMDGWTHPVCAGRWGPRRLILADAPYLELCAESEHWDAVYERAHGGPYQPPQEWEPGTPTWAPPDPALSAAHDQT